MSTIKMNGATIIITAGRNVSVSGNRIFVDGEDVTPDEKNIRIEVAGNIDTLQVDARSSIAITGDVGSVVTLPQRPAN